MTLTSTWPLLAWARPAMMLRRVLLPHPLGPMRHKSSPFSTVREVFSSATTGLAFLDSKYCETERTSIAATPVPPVRYCLIPVRPRPLPPRCELQYYEFPNSHRRLREPAASGN